MERKAAIALILTGTGTLAAGLSPSTAQAAENGAPVVPNTDFDFWIGDWKQKNRRLRTPLAGADDWYEFESRSTARHIWGGLGNMDEYYGDAPSGKITGMSMRFYDPKAEQWSIYWATAANPRVGVPTIGSFKNGVGEFFDQEDLNGKSILVRYTWSKITPVSCRWDQAFSDDFGKTWETNWIMENARA